MIAVGWSLAISIMLSAYAGSSAAQLPEAYDRCLGDPAAIFRRANELYEQGDPALAQAGYLFLIAAGAKNGYVHYNLGNAYFRSGRLGRAILEYERALFYLPRHADLRHNLRFVRGLMVDEELKPREYGGTLGLVMGLHRLLNLRENLILLCGLAWAVGLAYSLRILFPGNRLIQRTGWVRTGLVVALVLSIVSIGVKAYRFEHRDRAVILAPVLEAKTGPGDEYPTNFSLHEGTTVRVGTRRTDWTQIRLPNGWTGWVKNEDLEVI